MSDRAVAKRYAEGLLSYLQGTVGVEEGLAELERASRILEANPELIKLLSGWQITLQEKQEAIDAVFKKDFSEDIRRFLKLLVAKRRVANVGDVALYARLLYARDMEVEAVVKTAFPLEQTLAEDIKERLAKKLNKKINLRFELSPELIGGAKIVVGNTHLDGSIRRHLAELKEQLTALKVS